MKFANKIRTSYKIIALAIFLGILSWILDEIFDFAVFYNDSISNEILHPFSIREIIMAIIPLIMIIIFGLILAKKVNSLNKIRQELSDSRKWLYTTIKSIGDGVIATDKDENILLINNAAEKLTGWEKNEAIGKNIHDVFHIVNEYNNEKVEIPIDKVLKEGKIVGLSNHTVLISKDNNRINIGDSASPIRNEEDEIIGVILTFQNVTEQKRIYQELQKSEGKFKAIFNNTAFGSSLLSPKGEFLLANKGWSIISGYSNEELLKMKYSDLVYPDDNEATAIKMGQLIAGEIDSFTLGNRIIRKNGEIRYGMLIVKPLGDSDDNSNVFLGLLVDITERKNTEIKLKESQKKYKYISLLKKAILESPESIIVFALDKNYRYLDFTSTHKQTMKAIWGVNIEVGKVMLDYIKSDSDKKKAKVNFDRALNGEKFQIIEEYGDEKSQRPFYEDRYNPVFDENNTIIGLSVFVVDITERKKLELSLEKKNKFLISIFESITNPFYVLNVDDFSIAAANLSSKAQGDYYEGITCFALTHHSARKCGSSSDIPCPIEIMKQTKKPVSVIHKHFSENNVEKYYQVNGFPIIDDKGKLIQVIMSTVDITEKMATEKKIKNINIELEQKVKDRTNELNDALNKLIEQHNTLKNISRSLEISNQTLEKSLEKEKEIGLLKSQFVSMVSHEYRTPLTIILTSTDLIERYINKKELDKTPNLIKRIQNSVNDMEKMLEDVLMVGKSEKEFINLKFKNADFIRIIDEVIKTVNVYIDENRVIILNNNSGDDKLSIKTDIHFLKQIIQNIIINAHKYSPIDKPIIINIYDSGSFIELKISDSGAGIDEKELQLIFDPFYRNKDNIGSIKGTGLGLTIVKKLTDAMGIQIKIKSELGKGTEFSLYIPKNQM